MTEKTKLCILVEIQLDRPVKADLVTDVARRLERSAYDLIVARGGDCRDAKATIQQPAKPLTQCSANRDGDCVYPECPQLRDGEPKKSGRHCPLDSEERGQA